MWRRFHNGAEKNGIMQNKSSLLDNIILLSIGFLLTGILGTIINSIVQDYQSARNKEFQIEKDNIDRKFKSWEAEIRDMENLYITVSKIIDRRLVASRALDDAISGENGALPLEEARAAYRALLREWNENLNSRRAMVQMLLGDQSFDYYEKLSQEFLDVHRSIRLRLGQGQSPNDNISTKELIDKTNVTAFIWNQESLKALIKARGRLV